MWNAWSLILALLSSLNFCNGEDQRGIVHVYGSSRIRVKLECGPKFMNVNLFINGTAPFFDWIVVGKTNRAECRQQGNGDLQYLIEIPLLNDPCGTRMVAPSSTFENVISIKRMPLLILEGDETISVQCVYGPPEIGTPVIPTLPPSQNVQQSFLTTPKKEQPLDESSNNVETTKVAGILPAHVYLIIFMVLFLTLLCLCCGCMYFFFKRRKLRVERRKKLLLAVPANSEMSKLGLRHLWWSGKHGLGGSATGSGETVSNDALLSHDYMVSSNSTARGHLSVSTDYPGSTPPSSGGSSNASAGTANGLISSHGNGHGHGAPDAGSRNIQVYMHDDRRMLSRSHMDHPMANMSGRAVVGVMVASNVVANSLRCIPEERTDHLRSECSSASTARPQTANSPSEQISRRPVYASVEKKSKLHQSDSPNSSAHGEQSPPVQTPGDTLVSHVRSMSEIYSVPSHNGSDDNDADAASLSTLEGKQYTPTQEQICQATIVRADVHHMASPHRHQPMSPPPVPPPPLVSSPPPSSPPAPPMPSFEERNRRIAPTPRNATVAPPIDWEAFVRAVENDRSQILSDRDIDRWRRLLSDDLEVRRQVLDAKTLEDFEAVSHSPKYIREFAQEKWAVIVQNLAQVAFMRRLSNIIDNQLEQQQSVQKPYAASQSAANPKSTPSPIKPLDPSQLNSSYDMGETLRNLQQGRQKRLFTRESYYQVKQDVTPIAAMNDPDACDKHPSAEPYVVAKDGTISTARADHNQPSSTSTTMLSQPFRDRSNSEVFEMPPMLTVYLGDVASEKNLYGEKFLNGAENTYSTASNIGASVPNMAKSYHYESNGTKTDDDEHQYQIGAMISSTSVTESNVDRTGSVYAPPSSSTIYGPEVENGRWKHF